MDGINNYYNIAIAACLLIAILTLVITYIVHQGDLGTQFKGGFWFGLVCMSIAICALIVKMATMTTCDTEN